MALAESLRSPPHNLAPAPSPHAGLQAGAHAAPPLPSEDEQLRMALAESLRSLPVRPGPDAGGGDDVPMLFDDTRGEARESDDQADEGAKLAQALELLFDLLGEESNSVVKGRRGVNAAQSLECNEGDTLRVLNEKAKVEAAFADSDARFSSKMSQYLGSTGVVVEVDDESVRLKHSDGQQFWWAYGALSLERNGGGGRGLARPKPQWEKVFERYSKFWTRIAEIAVLGTRPQDIMVQAELDFFQKSVINTLTEAGWQVAKPIERILLEGARDVATAAHDADANSKKQIERLLELIRSKESATAAAQMRALFEASGASDSRDRLLEAITWLARSDDSPQRDARRASLLRSFSVLGAAGKALERAEQVWAIADSNIELEEVLGQMSVSAVGI
jgi:hypothetical protein